MNVFYQAIRCLSDRRVPFGYKFLYLLSVIGYAFVPDILPFLPFDDLVVAWLASRLFVYYAQKESIQKNKKYDSRDAIDIEGDIVE